MGIRDDFDENYDGVSEEFCRPYREFFRVGARALPKDVGSVCDLGIGSGNFSATVRKRLPQVNIYGIDMNEEALENARVKIPDAMLYKRKFFDSPLPETDYVISSLATHHFNNGERLARFEQIVRNGRGFINFDMFLMNENSLEDSIDLILEHVKKYCSDKKSLHEVVREVKINDNLALLKEQEELFRKIGMKFDVLAIDAPWVVYHAYWPSKNS